MYICMSVCMYVRVYVTMCLCICACAFIAIIKIIQVENKSFCMVSIWSKVEKYFGDP